MSTDSTPTTEDVRTRFAWIVNGDPNAEVIAVAEFDRWIATEIREARAAAWDEGWHTGMTQWDRARTAIPLDHLLNQPPNPYREAAA